MSRGPAAWATTVALGLVNVGLAVVIVELIGVHGFAPLWVGLTLVAVGLLAAVAAVFLWRQYLTELRQD
ncbi:MAG TPA: hypothetical protein VF937_16270 [Chloroflexota bacterium]